MVAPPRQPLAGVGVLVTRPVEQAEPLSHLIEAAGGRALRFPTLAIVPPTDPAAATALLERLAEYDLAIFVSPTAVEQALRVLQQRGLALPTTLAVGGIGAGTAAALKARGIDALAPTERFDSEGLLALPQLARVAGRRIVIVRGEGGRALLGDTLRERGAQVTYAECYRRVRPAADAAPLRDGWQRGEIDVVSITSVAALDNLHAMLGAAGRAALLRTPVAVLNATQAAAVRRLGFAHAPLVASQATDAALVQAIGSWVAQRT